MSIQAHILIIEDEIIQQRLISSIIKKVYQHVDVCCSGAEALTFLTDQSTRLPDVILLDQIMPEMNGIDVLYALRKIPLNIPVIMLTGQASLAVVVEAMRAGASDFIVKPASAERIRSAIQAALEGRSLAGNIVEDLTPQIREAGEDQHQARGFETLIGTSSAMVRAKRLGIKAAQSTIPVLIEGESGVGKEVFARAIHFASARRDKPFVAVNCGAIPDNLVESTLFGHEKGAFTGATENRTGMFEQAGGGTLFLDEVGELPLDVQVKLLRALQEREVTPVGARRTVKIDIRILSATNRILGAEVEQGNFREDLFYRLNVYPVLLAPLRDRLTDIPALTNHLLDRIARAEGMTPKYISARTIELLQSYSWPGNIRQLQNALFRAALLAEGDQLDIEDFPILSQGIDRRYTIPFPPPAGSPSQVFDQIQPILATGDNGHIRPLAAIEREHILAALKRYDGCMAEVARRLNIGRSTLYRKVALYGLEAEAKS